MSLATTSAADVEMELSDKEDDGAQVFNSNLSDTQESQCKLSADIIA